MKKTPHDSFVKYIFSFRSVYHDFFGQLMPTWLSSQMDLDTLEPVEGSFLSRQLKSFFTDKLFTCRLRTGTEICFALLLEHKSYVPGFIYDQLQRYVIQKLEHDRKAENPRQAVVPVILYHGKERWIKKPPHAFYPELPVSFRRFVQGPDYILVNISSFSKKKIMSLRMGYLVNSLLMLKYYHSETQILRHAGDIFVFGDFYQTTEEGRDFIHSLLVYLFEITNFDETTVQKMVEKISKTVQKKTMNSLQVLLRSEWKKGKQEGKKEGKREGKIEVAIRILRKYPDWPDALVADISSLSEANIKELRNSLTNPGKDQATPPAGDDA